MWRMGRNNGEWRGEGRGSLTVHIFYHYLGRKSGMKTLVKDIWQIFILVSDCVIHPVASLGAPNKDLKIAGDAFTPAANHTPTELQTKTFSALL